MLFPRRFARPQGAPPPPAPAPTDLPGPPAFDLPPSVQDWPTPSGVKCQPAHWMHPQSEYRTFLEGVLRQHGPDALALIWHDAPRTSASPLTRWFCPGLPIHTSGHQVQQGSRTLHGYHLPAQAALQAAERGLVRFHEEN